MGYWKRCRQASESPDDINVARPYLNSVKMEQSSKENKWQHAIKSENSLPLNTQKQFPTHRGRFRQSWRVGASFALLAVLLSLATNSSVAGWLLTHTSSENSVGLVYYGDCGKVKTMDTWVHLFINIISTMMLSGSNYNMQILVGPTREDIDHAHAQGKWLDIGIPSLRNLKYVARWRAVLWVTLALSSIPLHLMYNSAFYSTIETNNYNVLIVEEDFVHAASFSPTSSDATGKLNDPPIDLRSIQQRLDKFERLSNSACIDAYGTDVINGRRNLVIVSDKNASSTNSLLYTEYYIFSEVFNSASGAYNPYAWICDGSALHRNSECRQNKSSIQHNADVWSPQGHRANYCLSEKVDGQCSFNANWTIIVAVLVCNVLKAIAMIWTVTLLKSKPLLVVGDAVESFLNIPDDTTKTMSVLTRKDVCGSEPSWPMENTKITSLTHFPLHQIDLQSFGAMVEARPKTWRMASSRRRWIVTVSSLGGCVVMVFLLLLKALLSLQDRSWSHIWDLGFGSVNGETLIQGERWPSSNISSWSKQILASILIANMPQLVISFLYLNFNSLLTVMFMADEWSDFLVHRKALRVSEPRGEQRSTYFLQLPYKIAIPLMITSTLLHWLVSQSIFLAVIVSSNANGKLATDFMDSGNYNAAQTRLANTIAIATCGFSIIPMIVILFIGTGVLVGLTLLGKKKYNAFIPLVSSCSAAISAACHAPSWDIEASLKPLKWGVTNDRNDERHLKYCCFSSQEVQMPEDGKVYMSYPYQITFRTFGKG